MSEPRDDATRLLRALERGDEGALDGLVPLVYDDLKRVARKHLRDERGGTHTLTTTDLVHESYLRLVRQESITSRSRAQFLALASRVMRHILIDYARRKDTKKRGHDPLRVPLIESLTLPEANLDRLLTVDEVLTRLAEVDERLVRVVECRFFGGMQNEETAEALDVSVRTVERDWSRARAYLHAALTESPDGNDAG